jgi:CheY-like chemotaxis protein
MASLRLLIVEDDIPSLELMSEVFSSLHASVCAISDSLKAADLVDQQKFDGIFLDLEMPHMGGLELAQEIRKSTWNKSTPIVIVTGRDDRQVMQQSFATGATFFLQKPVDRQKLTTLFRTVRGALLENRRRYTRIPLQTDILCTVGARTFQGRTWNVSQGGILIEADNLQSGDIVRLSFQLPGAAVTIDAVGVVIWSKSSRQGIQFSKLSPQNDAELREFIEQADPAH